MSLQTLNQILKSHGLEPPPALETRIPDLEDYDLGAQLQTGTLSRECAETLGEVGVTGTRIIAGIVTTDPNPNMRPYRARGVLSGVGVYDELILDPVNLSSWQTLAALIKTGEISVALDPAGADHPDAERVLEDARELLTYFLGVEGGWDSFLANLSTAIYRGFATFEVVWQELESGRKVPHKFAFREQSTVQRWILDPDARDLVAIEYRTGGEGSRGYTLTTTGPHTEDHKVLHCGVGITGQRYEGLTPLRAVKVPTEYKQLLIMIGGAQSERFGCPVLLLEPHDALYRETQIKPNQSEWSAYYEATAGMTALDTPTQKTPFGLTARYLVPQSTPVNLVPLLQWLNVEISQAWSTQAQQLGHGGSGSYALGKVQDDDLTRAAPAYAQALFEGVNRLFRLILRREYGHTAPLLPELVWSERVVRDESKWLGDVLAYAERRSSMPVEWRAVIEDRLGLPIQVEEQRAAELQDELDQTGPDQTKPNQTGPDQTKPDQTGPDEARPGDGEEGAP